MKFIDILLNGQQFQKIGKTKVSTKNFTNKYNSNSNTSGFCFGDFVVFTL